MEEITRGDRVQLCELIRYIGMLGDDDCLRNHWVDGTFYSSFDSLVAIIFDDCNILTRAEMRPGYLGTPERLPGDLAAFAALLDDFHKSHPFGDRGTDLELLDLPDWEPLSVAATSIADVGRDWRGQHCEP
jgi:hypothetical protein